MRTSRHRCLAAVTAVASLSVIGASQPSIARAASPSVTSYAATDQGVVTPAHHLAAHSSATTGFASTRAHGRRVVHARGAAAASPLRAPAAPGVSGTSASTTRANFNGVSSLDSQLTNFNATFEPPDQGLCEGNGFVVEAVNSAYRVYRTNGTPVAGPFNVNDLFNEGAQQFTSDPRCQYDAATKTWFAEILFIALDNSSSHLDIAVNTSGDPTNLWTEYQVDTTHAGGSGCPCFGDQPRIGIDQYNVYLSTDEFSILGPQFNGAQVYALSKSDLIAGTPLHFAHFGNLTLGGESPLAVEPALSSGPSAAEYFLNSFDPKGTFDNRIGVWAMTDRTGVAAGHAPKLSATVITSEVYGLPVAAPQKGATSLLDGGDDRMQQTQFIAGNIWGELTSSVTIAGDNVMRDGAAWFEVHPTLAGNSIGTVTVTSQGYVAKAGNYAMYPALQADAAGRAAMVFTLTGASRYPSASYAVLNLGRSQFGAVTTAAAGAGPYDPTATRWGDYSWAVRDPLTGVFWMATEYVPPKPSQTTTGVHDWGTRVVAITVG